MVEDELEKSEKKERSISFAFLDVDFFKNINDTYGHVVGDQMLQELVSVVNAKLRRSDILARYGGDEFIFMFPDTSIEEGCRIVEEIRLETAKHNFIKDIEITISLGCTQRNDGENIDQIIEKIDRALYLAKKDS